MKVVFNSSPLIVLARLQFLDIFLDFPNDFYLPDIVAEEICVKSDDADRTVKAAIAAGKLNVRSLLSEELVNTLNLRLDKGESAAIALCLELQAERIILDDRAARNEAERQSLGADHPNTKAGFRNFIGLLQAAIEGDRTAELSDNPFTQSMLKEMQQLKMQD